MIELDLASINETSPYEVYKSNSNKNYYLFETRHGVQYAVGFLDSFMIETDEAYEFILTNTNSKASPRDAKVRDTIISIMTEFFRVNNSTVLYICDTIDGKQEMRNRLFNYWFLSYCNKAEFTILSTSIIDAEGIINCASIILRNDNPKYIEVMTEFQTVVQTLRNKP